MSRSFLKASAVVMSLIVASSVALAAEKEEGKKPAAAAKARGQATSRPAFLERGHAPKAKGWEPLFNGKNFDGWKSFPADRPSSWKVEDGVIVSTFKEGEYGTNIFTEKKYGDFEFYCEYLVPKDGNSGVFLRGQYEVQIQDDYGWKGAKAKDWGNGGIYNQKAPAKNASKPQGEWQTIYATMVGKELTVWLNGEKIIDKHAPPSPTHLYGEIKVKENDPTGPIILQGDHKPIKFRNVMIKPAKKAKA